MNKYLMSALLIGAGLCWDVLADSATGLVVASRGAVIATNVEGSRELVQGDEIFVEDNIVTAQKSFAVIQFLDGAKVTIKPESELLIEEYIYNGAPGDKAQLTLVSGGLRIITGAMAKEDYKLGTPVALMGVRGTEFSVQICEENCQ